MAVLPTLAIRVRLALRYIHRTFYTQSVTITVGTHKNTDTTAGRFILRTLMLFVFHPFDVNPLFAGKGHQFRIRIHAFKNHFFTTGFNI